MILKQVFFFYVKENVIYLIWLVLVVNCVIVSIPDWGIKNIFMLNLRIYCEFSK